MVLRLFCTSCLCEWDVGLGYGCTHPAHEHVVLPDDGVLVAA